MPSGVASVRGTVAPTPTSRSSAAAPATSSSSGGSTGRPSSARRDASASSQIAMIDRQHVWVGPEATSFEVPCEACLARRGGWEDAWGRDLPADSR